jgi:thiol-disulfide isomerase/thioredoxin
MKRLLYLSFLLVLAGSCDHHKGWKLASGIYILDKNAPVETLADLQDRLPRNAVYVDRWATWCGPCLEEFTCYDSLRPFLESKGIDILYLNSDIDIEESLWFDFIKENKLYGYHVRLNKQLQRDLIDQKVFIPRVPQFMIIDSAGTVLNHQALKPSDGKALQSQLSAILDQGDQEGRNGLAYPSGR